MRESTVEAHLVDNTEKVGGIAYKFSSPNRRNVPDRLVLLPVPREYQKIVSRFVKFVEVKATGKEPNSGQRREMERLRKLGYLATWGDSNRDMDLILDVEIR